LQRLFLPNTKIKKELAMNEIFEQTQNMKENANEKNACIL